MKKVILPLLMAGLFVAGVTSCKKDYTCACSGDGWTLDAKFENVKKKDAEETCDAAETTYKIGDATASCTLN